ncbi:hypothetical protein Bint_2363 [Brachyspira intermedia PWS/A]|uniref:Lipoprotein n=1 Tax=Brachyspira intermedia (strain ATCC 51140 / PWS/A) TaxID=1045858 RepID=G0EMS8_BRAIP|nr:hypothetical protein [Brachyspira intermedia]AEM22969.1 hypothetical protein Bint_2363 [Brachyspira intermedia PWS/A]
MNKKILSIIFTLFLAGLLSVSCSNKDTTGTGGNNDNGGASTTTTIPTGTQDGEGVDTSYQYKYASTADYGGLELTVDGKLSQTLTTQDQLQISTSTDKDPNLQGEYVGGVLIKMPQLTSLGFKSDLIRILPKNIKRNPGYGYDIHAVYVINNTNPEERLEYVELQTTGIQFGSSFITMNGDITLTKTTIVKEQDKDPVTTKVIYALKENKIKAIEKANSVTPIAGTPVNPQ